MIDNIEIDKPTYLIILMLIGVASIGMGVGFFVVFFIKSALFTYISLGLFIFGGSILYYVKNKTHRLKKYAEDTEKKISS